MQATTPPPWEVLRAYLERDDAAGLNDFLSSLSGEDSLRALTRLAPEEQQRILARVSPGSAADVVGNLPDAPAAGLLEDLDPRLAASIVREMDSDEQADVLGELDPEDLEEILRHMDEREAGEARELLAYPSDVAGGLMVTGYFSYPKAYHAGAVLADLAHREQDFELGHLLHVCVTDRGQQFAGIARIRDIVFAPPQTRLADIARPALTVRENATLDELENFFDEHDQPVVPVVDERGHLLGVVRRRSVYDAVAERAQSAYLKSQGVVGGEELRSMPTLLRSRRRLSWLSLNILLNLLAASVIAQFQDVLSAVIVLAVFLPIISDMSGCSGNQAVAVSMRELALGAIRPADAWYVWRKEAVVGVINGIALGVLLAAIALLWQGNPWLGLVVGLALAVNTLIAVSIGGTVPVLLKALKVDPAVASGPILTTVTDMCGFFLLLGTASLLLPQLSGT